MKWKTKIYLFTQWAFVLSIIWFTTALFYIGIFYWYVLVIVPIAGLVATGYMHELKNKEG